MTWSLVALKSGARVKAAALSGTGEYHVIDVLPADITPIQVFENWDKYADVLRAWTPEDSETLTGVEVDQPLQFPRKLICIGANYREHRREMAADVEGAKAKPFFFLKPPTTALVGPGANIPIRSVDDRVDWEAEVAIVIGKGGRFIQKADALASIAGVTLANDISARGVHHQPDAVAPPFSYDWLASKAQDGFCPLGPGIVPTWFVDDVEDIAFSLSVNGEVQQSSTTAYTVTSVLDQVVAASNWMTLEPGDVILTGTPAGVGAGKGLFLKPGDEVVVSSPLIGELANTVTLIGA